MLPFPFIRENSRKTIQRGPIVATNQNSDESRPDARALLEEFVSSGRSESAFTKLFHHFGGLVYSSALRRTDHRQLAEEVTQNVFTILARKAAAVRRHPNPTAWIFQTTKLEAAKAMRSENRKNRKHAALAKELNLPNSQESEDAEAWRDVLPHLDDSLDHLGEKDRQIILDRFFEEKKFREIAAETGRTEAACKMQVKRALEKLSRLLSQKGVTLSATAIATGLAAEFTKAAPLSASVVVPQALGASSAVSATALVTNTLQTMSTIKSVSVTTAAVLAVASVPFFWQESKANNYRTEIEQLESRQTALEEETSRILRAPIAQSSRLEGQPARTIRDLLAAADEPLDADSLINQLMEAMMSQDIMGMLRLFIPLSTLNTEEYEELLADIESHEGNAQMKTMTLEMLGSFNPSTNYRESIERVMGLDIDPKAYGDLFSQWAAADPEAAATWFESKLQTGELLGKGIHNTPDKVLFPKLINGIGRENPELALETFLEQQDKDLRNSAVWYLARVLGKNFIRNGDPALIDRFMQDSDGLSNEQFISNVITNFDPAQGGNDALAFAESYLRTPQEVGRAMSSLISRDQTRSTAEKADWLVEKLSPEQITTAIKSFTRDNYFNNKAGIDIWTSNLDPSPIRDIALEEMVHLVTSDKRFDEAERLAEAISDEEMRQGALEYVNRRKTSTEETGKPSTSFEIRLN
ncbi:MAG: sigma-70 family RNA polymerase sigma factor [Verrucomicrobiota bacterium]